MRIPVIAAALLLSVTGAFAADANAPLSPGKPAGTKQAQMQGDTWLWVLGGAAIVVGIALVASSGGGNSNNNGAAPASATH
jgi:hypothetical protein